MNKENKERSMKNKERNYGVRVIVDTTDPVIDSIVENLNTLALENNLENFKIYQNKKEDKTEIRIETDSQLENFLCNVVHSQLYNAGFSYEKVYDPLTLNLMEQDTRDKNLSQFIENIDRELEHSLEINGKYKTLNEVINDNEFDSKHIFSYLKKQFSEYINGTRDRSRLYGGNIEEFTKALTKYTRFSENLFELSELCLLEAEKDTNHKLYPEIESGSKYYPQSLYEHLCESSPQFNEYFVLIKDSYTYTEKNQSIKKMLNNLESFYPTYSEEHYCDYWQFMTSQLGHSHLVVKTLLDEWNDYLEEKITEDKMYGGNFEDFLVTLHSFAYYPENKPLIEMAQKEVEKLGTAKVALAIKEWQKSSTYEFVDYDFPGELDKIIKQANSNSKTIYNKSQIAPELKQSIKDNEKTNQKIQTLEKENKVLKIENESLKKDMSQLKREVKILKKGLDYLCSMSSARLECIVKEMKVFKDKNLGIRMNRKANEKNKMKTQENTKQKKRGNSIGY